MSLEIITNSTVLAEADAAFLYKYKVQNHVRKRLELPE